METNRQDIKQKQYDFSEFNEFFNDIIWPYDFVDYLHEIRASYLQMSLCTSLSYIADNRKILPPEEIDNHIFYLTQLIKLVKTLK
ncbi:MAG: hypothetical protein LBB62_05140 [Proteiniphilum sp.]|jgi:hypothetical protein|nr:hypothetical protein [Proteiniphilum sp.]